MILEFTELGIEEILPIVVEKLDWHYSFTSSFVTANAFTILCCI